MGDGAGPLGPTACVAGSCGSAIANVLLPGQCSERLPRHEVDWSGPDGPRPRNRCRADIVSLAAELPQRSGDSARPPTSYTGRTRRAEGGSMMARLILGVVASAAL